jgi:SAM-dependent methyltransferase
MSASGRDADAERGAVRASDSEYASLLAREAAKWAVETLDIEAVESLVPARFQRALNESLTGRPEAYWLDDLIERGPYPNAAALGSTAGYLEERWQGRHASESLDIYELSTGVIEKTRNRLSRQGLLDGVRFIESDLNRATLPSDAYDVVWSASAVHHLVELEHVCREVTRALKPGGLFVFYEYVGENRVQFSAERIRAATEVAADVAPELWREERSIKRPSLDAISPFEAIRAEEIRDVVSAHFDVVHWGEAGVLMVPIFYAVDLHALDARRPDILDRLLEADRRELQSGRFKPCLAYGVMRRKAPTQRSL